MNMFSLVKSLARSLAQTCYTNYLSSNLRLAAVSTHALSSHAACVDQTSATKLCRYLPTWLQTLMRYEVTHSTIEQWRSDLELAPICASGDSRETG